MIATEKEKPGMRGDILGCRISGVHSETSSFIVLYTDAKLVWYAQKELAVVIYVSTMISLIS